MTRAEQWQLAGSGPELYERFAVGRHLRPIAEEFVRRLAMRCEDRVLDVACGTGIVARLVAPRIEPPGHVVGLDLNAGMLAVAQRLGEQAQLAIRWCRADAAALPFGRAEFDVVLCQQGLQFIPDKARALHEMRRVLVPGGRVALNVFGAASRFHTALSRGLTKFSNATAARLSLAPFAFGDAAALQTLVNAAGFQDIRLSSTTIARRVEPTQEWLLQYSSGLPYAAAVEDMSPAQRAQMLREIAAELKGLWIKDDEAGDSFVVPCEVHFIFARA